MSLSFTVIIVDPLFKRYINSKVFLYVNSFMRKTINPWQQILSQEKDPKTKIRSVYLNDNLLK